MPRSGVIGPNRPLTLGVFQGDSRFLRRQQLFFLGPGLGPGVPLFFQKVKLRLERGKHRRLRLVEIRARLVPRRVKPLLLDSERV